MTIEKLQDFILAQEGNTILSTEAVNIAHVLAEAYDTFQLYNIAPIVRDHIIKVFHYERPFYWGGITAGKYTMMEALHKGKIHIDSYPRAYEVWENVKHILQGCTPDGFTFRSDGDGVGWFEDVEELTLQHVRTLMHNMAPSMGYNKHTEKDALYLLDTLYAWIDKGIPVSQKYLDLLQNIVDSHKEGDGL